MVRHFTRSRGKVISWHVVIGSPVGRCAISERCDSCGLIVIRGMGRWWE
jgi:hypothetical protein